MSKDVFMYSYMYRRPTLVESFHQLIDRHHPEVDTRSKIEGSSQPRGRGTLGWDFETAAGTMKAGAGANMKAASAAEPELAHHQPCDGPRDHDRRLIMFSIATIGIYMYIIYSFFKGDGPLWEAYAFSAAESPLFMIPLCGVPKIRNALIRTYAMGPPPGNTGSDLASKLLADEKV
ncbi:hypothetical protein ACP70R_011623 [Stipagrostis hirtigluma subsp. patula]